MGLENIHYDAFISYRHAELDQFVATNLHKKLENFKLPKSLIGKVKNGKTKIERVFRDEDELPLSDNLSDPISEALANSDYLIIICTPRYPQSRWCIKEIEVFLQTHDRKDILVVLAEAEPSDSFPEIITYEEYSETFYDGTTIIKRRELEPLAADTRGATQKDILKAMDTAVIKLCAAIFGLNYDDLRQRHREQKMKKMFAIFGTITAVMSAVAIVMLILMMTISSQKQTIQAQYNELEDKYAGSMAVAAKSLIGEGRTMDALYAVRSVLPEDETNSYNSEAYYMLNRAINTYLTGDGYIPLSVYNLTTTVFDYKVSKDGAYLAAETIDGSIYLFNGKNTQEPVCIERYDDADFDVFAFTSENMLIYTDKDKVYKIDPAATEPAVITDIGYRGKIYSDSDSDSLICFGDDYLYGVAPDGDIVYRIDLVNEINAGNLKIIDAAFDKESYTCVLTDDNVDYVLCCSDLGDVKVSFWIDHHETNKIALHDDIIYLCQNDEYSDSNKNAKVYAIDTNTGMTLWIQDFASFTCNNLIANDNYIYVCGDYSISVFDSKYGKLYNSYTYADVLVDSYSIDEKLYLIDGRGHINIADRISSNDYTYTLFEELPGRYIINSTHNDTALYYQFLDANYIVKYASGDNKHSRILDDSTYKNKKLLKSKSAEDIIDSLPDINIDYVKKAFYSNDESIIVVEYLDDSIIMYDAHTFEKKNTLYDYHYEFGEMLHAEDIDAYILTAYSLSLILNSDLEVIADSKPISEYSNGDFIISDEMLYAIPYVPYAELIKRADDILGDYQPSEEIKGKYNIK
ncbi:MAG: toll/interleukin-1 receptor domain-containing protein [Lachnospiraceae bacterium]|nr:toll/interleukin-1 receptor domain-containing protein [Lachnospiraceae bacterium]